jgi:hypothetical protein
MGYLIAGLVLALGVGYGISQVPTDHELGARMEAAIRTAVRPAAVQVQVHRHSRFSRTVQQLDIEISGFTLNALPGAAVAAPAPAAAVGGKAVAPAPAPAKPKKREKYVTIRAGSLHASKCTVMGVALADTGWNFTDVKVPMSAVMAGGFAISSFGSATGHATITEAAAARLVPTQGLPLENPTLQLTPEGVRLRGTYSVALLKVPVTVTGHITARGATLSLEHPEVQVTGITLPDDWSAKLTRACNPLVDLSAQLHLPMPVTVTRVTHGAGILTLDATLQMPREAQ